MKNAFLLNILIVLSMVPILAGAQPGVVEASGLKSGSEVAQGTVFVSPSPKLTLASCKLTDTSPDVKLGKGAYFDAVWTVKNTADLKWNKNDLDYKYISGKKMVRSGYRSIYDLPSTIKPGGYVKIRVKMVAPTKRGTYYAKWAIVLGSKRICTLPLTIRVK